MPNFLDIYSNEQIQLTESADLGHSLYTFTPMPLGNIKLSVEGELVQLLIDAHRKLGEVKGMLGCIEDKQFIVKLFRLNESIFSCRIDNIDIDLLDLFTSSKKVNIPDVTKVNKYYKAMRFPKAKILTQQSLNDLHTSVMADDEIEYWKSRQHDFLGNIRTVQTHLSLKQGISVVNELKYNPTPPKHLHGLFDEMIAYSKDNSKYDILVKLALLHYQFESLHPFLGGNGRIGRLLVQKMLFGNGLINYSVLPFSEYLAQNKVEYFDRLWSAQYSKNLTKWVKYFLIGIINSSELAIKRLSQYVKLRKSDLEFINEDEKHRVQLHSIYRLLNQNIIIDIKMVSENLGISFNTAAKLVNILHNQGIINLVHNQRRYRLYVYGVVAKLLNQT